MFTIFKMGSTWGNLKEIMCALKHRDFVWCVHHHVSEFDDPGSNAAETILKPMPIRTASNGLVDSWQDSYIIPQWTMTQKNGQLKHDPDHVGGALYICQPWKNMLLKNDCVEKHVLDCMPSLAAELEYNRSLVDGFNPSEKY